MKVALAFLFGCCWVMQWARLPSYLLMVAVGLGCVVGSIFADRLLRNALIIVGWVALGIAWQAWHCSGLMQQNLPVAQIKRDTQIVGVISGIPVCSTDHCQFQLTTEKMNGKLETQTVQLSWYHLTQPVQVGQRWQMVVRLKPPFGSLNPGGFDAQAWYWQQHIRATGYVRTGELLEQVPGYTWTRWRSRLLQQLQQALPNEPLQPVLAALSIGWTHDISFEQRQVVQRTGTAHLLAISGLHVGLIVGMIFGLTQKLWSWIPKVPLWLPAPTAASVISIAAAFGYSALAGFACSTQRACVMCTVLLLGKLTRRHVHAKLALMVSLWLVLWLDPCVVLGASFWLSFVAVFILIWTPLLENQHTSKWRSYFAAQWVCWIGLMPLSCWYFQQISLVSMLANMIAIPWIGTVVVPLSLLGTILLDYWFWLGSMILLLASKLLGILWIGMAWLSQQHWAVWSQGIHSRWMFGVFLIGCLSCVLLRHRRYLGVFGVIPALWPFSSGTVGVGEVMITVLDVGQGLSCVVRTATHCLVYDTGAKLSPRYDVGRGIVSPYLIGEGVHKIDALVVSHGDNDHAGGADSLLQAFPVSALYTSAEDRFTQYHPAACLAGFAWDWDGVHMQFLHPVADSDFDTNNNSCVLKVTGRHGTVLFVGDIERQAELQLVARAGENLASDVLVVPHHGSLTSSSEVFLSAVEPEWALFSYGYLNRYRHPSKQVVQRYEDRGIACLDTVSSGAITLKLGNHIQLTKYRDAYRQFWRK